VKLKLVLPSEFLEETVKFHIAAKESVAAIIWPKWPDLNH
jgi:hypothetical protein